MLPAALIFARPQTSYAGSRASVELAGDGRTLEDVPAGLLMNRASTYTMVSHVTLIVLAFCDEGLAPAVT